MCWIPLGLISTTPPCSSAAIPKETYGWGGESSLVEVSEGHDVAVGRRRRVLIVGQPPLLSGGPRAKETTTNKALQSLEGDIRTAPRLHWTIEVVDANSTMAETRMWEA